MQKVPQFQVQQIALCMPEHNRAIELLADLGLTAWFKDHVTAHGTVFGVVEPCSKAELNFNYQAGGSDPEAHKPLELEVLHYESGMNWMADSPARVSHLGMHCTEEQLTQYFAFFRERQIEVAQELFTDEHTNPAIAGKRNYHYVIFDTYPILGVDLKFIVRRDIDQPVAAE